MASKPVDRRHLPPQAAAKPSSAPAKKQEKPGLNDLLELQCKAAEQLYRGDWNRARAFVDRFPRGSSTYEDYSAILSMQQGKPKEAREKLQKIYDALLPQINNQQKYGFQLGRVAYFRALVAVNAQEKEEWLDKAAYHFRAQGREYGALGEKVVERTRPIPGQPPFEVWRDLLKYLCSF